MSVLSRIFLVLLLVALPPLLGLSLLFALGQPIVGELGHGTTLLIVTIAAVGWAAAMSLVTARSLGRDVDALIGVAERGADDDVAPTDAQRRIRAALDERNRQLDQLAAHVRALPITDAAVEVARRTVAAVREVTGNPTWTLAVLHSSSADELPPGVYADEEAAPAQAIDDLQRWAAVTDEADSSGVRHGESSWGAFVMVDVGDEELLRAVLMAPWEGRPWPSVADRSLLLLVAQHASLALEHALLYARARRQAEELDRLAALQRDFLRGVTHDLQTPLTSIRAVASELRATRGPGDASVADLLVIEHQADRLRRMVAQLLAVSRLEAGALEPQVDVVRVEPLVQRTWDALRAERPFELTAGGEPHLAIADPDRLEQVLWALLDNAVKYSSPDSPVAVHLSGARRQAGGLESVIEVHDHGVGMDPTTRRQAFEQFYRSDIARRMVPDGSGIGLYAASGLVRAMGGSLEATSAGHGLGTVMKIRLPAEPVGEATGPAS